MKNKLLILSLPSILAVLPIAGWSEIRVGNHSRTYADDYNQINQTTSAARTVSTDTLPIYVANEDLATRIASGDTTANVTIDNLDACQNIYPSGEFAWDTPNAGLKKGISSTCVSVVEMRVIKGTDDIVVARANVAAGDSVKCNISDFPESGYTSDVEKVVFPADKAPTVDDVTKVMNAEQKKNAGFKIAAGVIVGGLVGNAAGENDTGESKLIGTSDSKLKGAAIGALSGGALMAGSSYAGKVGGDVIMSAGVNAAAGGVIGNIVANGDSVLRIEDCDLEGENSQCLWGIVEKKENITGNMYFNTETKDTVVCSANDISCEKTNLLSIKFEKTDGTQISIEDALSQKNFFQKADRYSLNNKIMTLHNGGEWVEIISAGKATGDRTMAMLDLNGTGIKDKAFGLKINDWYKLRNEEKVRSAKIWGRLANGDAYEPNNSDGWTVDNFYPVTVDSDDGSLIDINNKSRMKGTLVGAGAGASLGALTAYQGANDEVDARWISAVQEYKDSLQKVYCATGTRFLSQYNDTVIIPTMDKE